MVAAVIIERLDQRGPGRHGMLAGERVIGKPDQIVRAVGEPLRDQMRDFFGAALDIALDQDQARAHHLFAVFLHHLRPHHDIGDAGLVLQRHEHHAFGAARPLPHQHHTGATHRALVVPVIDILAGDDALSGKHRTQEFHRMAFERQPDGLVVGNDLLGKRHHG